MAHSQDCRTRIEAASRTDLVFRDRAERAEQRKMDFHAKEVERIDNPRRASLEPSVVLGPPTEEKEGEGARDAKRARGKPEQDLPGEIPIPSADDTLTKPEIRIGTIFMRCCSCIGVYFLRLVGSTRLSLE